MCGNTAVLTFYLVFIYLFMLHQNLSREARDSNHDLWRKRGYVSGIRLWLGEEACELEMDRVAVLWVFVSVPLSDYGFYQRKAGQPVWTEGCWERKLRGWWWRRVVCVVLVMELEKPVCVWCRYIRLRECILLLISSKMKSWAKIWDWSYSPT